MSRVLPIALGIGAVSLVGVTYFVTARGETTDDAQQEQSEQKSVGQPRAAAQGGGYARPKDLSGRVQQLETEMDALRKEVALMRRSAGILKRPIGADQSEVDADDPVFEGSVRQIIEADKEEEREAERERRKERWTAMTESSLAELRDSSGVSEEQSEKLATIWQTEADLLMPLIEQARAGERPFDEVREELTKAREKSDAQAKALLTDEQYEAYLELRPRGRGGPGGPGGGGGRPGPRGDGG